MGSSGEVVGRGGFCDKCGTPFPKRAKSVEKRRMQIMGLDTKATIRIYECRACGERKAKIDAIY